MLVLLVLSTLPRPDLPRLRSARPDDAAACYAVLYASVHGGTDRFYSPAERMAWAPDPTPPEGWQDQLLAGYCCVATDHEDRIIGFMTMAEDGFLDFAYVTPDWMGRGAAAALYDRIEDWARTQSLSLLTTEASHLSQRFLTRRGWITTARQSVIRHSVALTNFRMEKPL